MWFSFYAVNNQPIHICATHKTSKWIGSAVVKIITFSIMTTNCNIHSVRHAAPPHPEQKLSAIFHVQKWNGFPVISMRRSVQSKQVVCRRRPTLCYRWISSRIWLIMWDWQHQLDGMIPKHHQDLFATPAFPAQGLSAMLVSPGKGMCRHHRFARALARCHCKQWVPCRLNRLGVRSFRLIILQQNPIFAVNCEKLWVFNHIIPMICQFQTYI